MPKFEVRNDAGPSLFLTQELESMIAEQYRADLPPLKIFDLIPVDTSVDSRAAYISYSLLTQIGAAALMRSPNAEIPYVDLYRQKFTSPIKEMLGKYGWGVTEQENAEYAGISLDREGADAARRAFAELSSRIALLGDAPTQLPGLINNPNIPRSTAAAGASLSTRWANKTADEMIADLTGLSGGVVSLSKGVYSATTLLLPITAYNLIASKARSTYSDTTVLQYFLKSDPYIKNVEWLRELTGAGTGGTDMAIVYDNNPRNFAYYMPLAFEQRPQQERDLRVDVICREKTGGTIIRKPLAMAIIEGI